MTTMPKRRDKLPFVRAASGLKDSLAQGHPWIYADAIERAPHDLASGQWVHVQCGNLQLYGLWDADSPIAVRLFPSRRRPTRAWVAERVAAAWALRAPLRRAEARTSAWRWLYGESDGLPGLVVDLYGDVGSAGTKLGEQWAVLRTYSESLHAIKEWVVDAMRERTPLAGVVERDGQEHTLLHGRLPPTSIIIAEHGVRYEVDLLHGQKTGFFLDQRDNRRTVGEWSRGKRVLNLFAYTGGFSVSAALGGAHSVTSVDSAAPAMAAAQRNFQLNGLGPGGHEFIVADCFELLEKYHGEGRRFDLIVVDPPSFARSKAQLEAALHAYRRLNTLALLCLEPDGLLASSSCTSQVSPEAFRQMLAAAATDANRRVLSLHEAGQPLDHPVPVHFPEARYLKFVLAAVEPALS